MGRQAGAVFLARCLTDTEILKQVSALCIDAEGLFRYWGGHLGDDGDLRLGGS